MLDVYTDCGRFMIWFNSSAMAVQPNSTVFFGPLSKVWKAPMHDEQEFSNQVLRLLHVCNGNLVTKARSRTYWDAVWEEMRIARDTVISSSDREPVC